jgi:predicted membrane channel-forming protein YqfA (hemolysin III family)
MFKLSSAAKKALVKGIVMGMITLTIYLLVVVITTPNLLPFAAINAALNVNWIIIFGLAVSVGSQIYVSNYGKSLGCSIPNKSKGILGSSGSTAISSFFSFFSLIQLGCCGSWLLILSFIPSILGTAFSVTLIQYSKPLSYLRLFIVLGYTAFSATRLKRKLKKTQIFETKRKIS